MVANNPEKQNDAVKQGTAEGVGPLANEEGTNRGQKAMVPSPPYLYCVSSLLYAHRVRCAHTLPQAFIFLGGVCHSASPPSRICTCMYSTILGHTYHTSYIGAFGALFMPQVPAVQALHSRLAKASHHF
jgi:hypothetical protein